MTAPDKADISAQWDATLALCGDLLPYLAELRLSVSATQVATAMRLPNADALRRLLLKRRLPPFRVLRDWYYLVRMLERAERGEALGAWSMQRGDYADVYYRFVARLTGQRWGKLVQRGSAWAKAGAVAAWAPYVDET